MLSFECIKNEKSVYFLLTSAHFIQLATRGLDFGQPFSLHRVCCPILHPISNPQARFWAVTPTSPRMLPNASFSVFNRLLLCCICISFALQGIYKILQLEHAKNPAKIKNKMDSCFRRTEYLDIEQ